MPSLSLLTACFWALSFSVFASPLAIDVPDHVLTQFNTSLITLSAQSPPDGGPDFSITVGPGQGSAMPFLQKPRMLYCILTLMSSIAVTDWKLPMPKVRGAVRCSSYPRLTTAITAVGQQPMERREVLWGLASCMDLMLKHNNFRPMRVQLYLRSRNLGSILFTNTDPPVEAEENSRFHAGIESIAAPSFSDSDNDDGTSSNNASDTTPSLSTGTRYSYDFHGAELDTYDILMGTMGAVVQAAELPPHIPIKQFIGSWQQRFGSRYRCFQIWMTISDPSVLSKDRLLESMIRSVYESLERADRRELKMLARIGGLPVWQGGFAQTPGPDVMSKTIKN
ncbi:MAG: hypothetical protein LQ348_002739 [Seirophora lacunosa]|nr:MAG: hypothetical protein LQ348_002739 [Seirophora lacunosa]